MPEAEAGPRHPAGLAGRPRWRVRGASMQGYDHVRSGGWCEDSFAHTHIPLDDPARPDIQILAVADGAGSRSRSADGSRLAVSTALAVVEQGIRAHWRPESAPEWTALLQHLSEQVIARFVSVARAVGGGDKAIGDFATTLTTVVLAHPVVGYFSVGDGFVIIRTGAGGRSNLHLVDSAVATAQDASTTTFLTSHTAGAVRVNAIYDEAITGVFISTDGLAYTTLARDDDGQLSLVERPMVDTVFRLLDQDDFDPLGLLRLLQRDDVIAATQDDTTLLAAVLQR
jgi:hypothetical protein